MKIATAAATAHRLLSDVSATSVEWHNVALISDVINTLSRSKKTENVTAGSEIAIKFDAHWKSHQMCDSQTNEPVKPHVYAASGSRFKCIYCYKQLDDYGDKTECPKAP